MAHEAHLAAVAKSLVTSVPRLLIGRLKMHSDVQTFKENKISAQEMGWGT
jgi:hypothetical protein